MALPPSLRLWVGMVVVVMVELPGFLQKCIFDEVQTHVRVVRAAPIIHPGSSPTEPRLRQTGQPGRRAAPPAPASPQPIRIHTWITRESDNLLDGERERVEAAVEEAVRTVSSLLSVNRAPGPLLLSRDVGKYCKFLWRNSSAGNLNRCARANSNYRAETCLDVTIPDDHLAGCDVYPEADSQRRVVLRPEGPGLPDTDFLLYLHVKSTDRCRAEPQTVAYAVHCRTDAHGRPVAGVVVICRDRLTRDTYKHKATVQMLIHELVHALGFSKHLFHTWRHCSSSSQVGTACSPRGRVTHSDESGQMRIYTQSVVAAVQRHLGSTDPELGGPLENLGVPPGAVSSHWESRVLRGSIMVAALEDSTKTRIDAVTLAALRDTGWYSVNLSQAQSLVWGDGEGAMFGSLSTCKDNSSNFFCAGSRLGCHFLHLHKGQCQTDPYLEGCRVYKLLLNGSECWKTENSRRSAEEEWSGEIFGSESRCFFSNMTKQNQSQSALFNSSVEGRCYRHRCTGSNTYQVLVSGSEWVNCPAGGVIQITGYRGVVFCPDRRLCFFPDFTPPSDDFSTFPVFSTSDPYGTSTLVQDGTWSPLRPPAEVTALTALCFPAAVCLLAAVVICFRKCRSCRVRVHSAPEDHRDL